MTDEEWAARKRQLNQAYYQAHKGTWRENRAEPPEQRQKQRRRWYLKYKDQIKAQRAAYRAAHPEKGKEYYARDRRHP
jgi:spore coat polysaccharide biosynthesis protein SpsF (cytidylyltransferase family)